MLILYTQSICPTCSELKRWLFDKKVDFEEKDTYVDNSHLRDLVNVCKCEDKEVPFLCDTKTEEVFHKKKNIIKHIEDNYLN